MKPVIVSFAIAFVIIVSAMAFGLIQSYREHADYTYVEPNVTCPAGYELVGQKFFKCRKIK
jgi:hypothetical protein